MDFFEPTDKAPTRCKNCQDNLLFECTICFRKYLHKSNIFSHLKTKNDCRKMPDLSCSHCTYTSIHKGFLKNHMLTKHYNSINNLKECKRCGRHFKRSVNAEEHELSCGKMPYIGCLFCDFKTSYRIRMKVHMNYHIVDPSLGAGLVDENLQEVTVDPTTVLDYLWKPGM